MHIRAAFRAVFSRFGFVFFSLAVAVLAFVSATLFPHFTLLYAMATEVTGIEFFRFTAGLFGGVIANYTPWSLASTISITALFGIYASMFVFLLRMRATVPARSGVFAGIGAILSGTLGIGCAACGALFAGTFFSAIGAGAAIALLPFGGSEFAFLGILLLCYAIIVIARSISANRETCTVP